ncbi:hypothetical protein V8E55_009966 [Tylopilus felleus]
MLARGFALLSAFLASASHLTARDTCSNGDIYCCDSKASQGSDGITSLSGLFGLDIPFSLLADFNCDSLGVAQITGNDCTEQTVCCQNVTGNALISTNCSPINLGL